MKIKDFVMFILLFEDTCQSTNEKLPYVNGKVVFLRSGDHYHSDGICHKTTVTSIQKNPKSRHLADDILSKIMFDENLAICLRLRFRLLITIGHS